MNLTELKRTLKDLKEPKKYIYDYEFESDSPFYEVFTYFYDRKEAIDILLDKIKNKSDFNNLKYKLDPTNRSISIKDIEDAKACLNQFAQFKEKNGLEIIEHIKYLNEGTIKKMISYSKLYPLIKELDSKNEKDIFGNIYTIIEDASLTFKLDGEIFRYSNGDEKIEIKIEDLINLKIRLIFKQIIIKKKEEKENTEKGIYQVKCEKLIFFRT